MPSPRRAAVWPESGTLVLLVNDIEEPLEEELNRNVPPGLSLKVEPVALAVPVPWMTRVPAITWLVVIETKSKL